MRAPGRSVSGWHDSCGRAIVNFMSAKRPRARRSRMCRSVSTYGVAARGTDDVEPELRAEAL